MKEDALAEKYFALWFIFVFGSLVSWMILAVVGWRFARAHRRIADALEALAKTKTESSGGPA